MIIGRAIGIPFGGGRRDTATLMAALIREGGGEVLSLDCIRSFATGIYDPEDENHSVTAFMSHQLITDGGGTADYACLYNFINQIMS